MAVCAGAEIRDLCRAHGLPQPAAILSSPLLRCVQTCAGAAQGMGVSASVCVEPALCETICEDWYRSWGVPGADGTWGGPAGSDASPAPPGLHPPGLHPAALGKVSDLFLPPAALSDAACVPLDEAYRPFTPAASLDYAWGRYEAQHGTDASTGRRIGRFCADYARKNPGATFVVCTHGGPSAACFRFLTGPRGPSPPAPGHTDAISALRKAGRHAALLASRRRARILVRRRVRLSRMAHCACACATLYPMAAALPVGQEFSGTVGYTGIHVLAREANAGQESTTEDGGGWRALVAGSTDHLRVQGLVSL